MCVEKIQVNPDGSAAGSRMLVSYRGTAGHLLSLLKQSKPQSLALPAEEIAYRQAERQ